jgi:hypothetical protein
MIATSKDVRAWARAIGLAVSKRGPIDQATWAHYLDRHPEAHN